VRTIVAGAERGLLGLALSPDFAVSGHLFATENGPTFGDEVNFIQRDRNYEWKGLPPGWGQFPLACRVVTAVSFLSFLSFLFCVVAALREPSSSSSSSSFRLCASLMLLLLSRFCALALLRDALPFLA